MIAVNKQRQLDKYLFHFTITVEILIVITKKNF